MTTVGLTERVALSPAQAAELLGCVRATIYALIARGELTAYKVGRLTRLNTAEVLALVGGVPPSGS